MLRADIFFFSLIMLALYAFAAADAGAIDARCCDDADYADA